MKQKIFNIIVYTSLFWAILSAIYVSLPIEYQAMLPFMNEGTAIVGGITTLFTGTGGLAVQHFLHKTKTYNQDLNKALVDKVLFIIDEYKIMEDKFEELKKSTDKTNSLIGASLRTKLDNPMLTDTARELIEGVTNDKKE